MVIALDKYKRPLGFVTERRARRLFEKKRAFSYRYFPMVIIIKDIDSRTIANLPEYRIKIDPGAKTDGIAIIDENRQAVIWAMQIEHRGEQVKKALETRKNARRNRRSREIRYRRCKYKNGDGGHGQEGKIPPSILSIIGNTKTWVNRLCRWINITSASLEAVRFDTQLMDDPDIEGEEYQHGTLYGTELREYLLDKFGHTCQYCGGQSGDPVLEWEHIRPKSEGGTDKVSNATLSCRACNQAKSSLLLEKWLAQIQAKSRKSQLDKARIAGIQKVMAGKTSKSNRYCAWVNVTRRKLESFLFDTFGDAECSSGGRTKYNRTRLGFPKDHQYDAACIGTVPENGYTDLTHGYYMKAIATGRGTRFRGKINKCGIITQKLPPRAKRIFGFMNGDIVAADVPEGYKAAGHHVGRVTVRADGYLYIRTTQNIAITVRKDFVKLLQYADGYRYQFCRTKPGIV